MVVTLAMISDTAAAILLLACLAAFFSVNLHNIMRFHTGQKSGKSYAEVERPKDFMMLLAAFGTFVLFVATLLFVFFALAGLGSLLAGFAIGFQFLFIGYNQIVGLGLTFLGYFVFIWSVIARGKYATSWEMPEHQRLVTWGPYRYVRHPSYLGYILMFTGMFLLWPNLLTLLSLPAILGYYKLTFQEERLLAQRFNKEYAEYQRKTGRFIPKLR